MSLACRRTRASKAAAFPPGNVQFQQFAVRKARSVLAERGRPNSDGTLGTCTACHTRHTASVEVARLPSTCGQCHLGPDHSQIEIYEESKHGVLF
jgi:hypothetical protein